MRKQPKLSVRETFEGIILLSVTVAWYAAIPLLLFAAASLPFMVEGCSTSAEGEAKRFYSGDYVRHKLDGRVGIVIRDYGTEHRVLVRFVGTEVTTNVSLLGADAPVAASPYTTIWCEQFEVERAERPKQGD